MAVIPGVLFKVSGGESLLCAVFDRKGIPFVYLLLTKLFLGGGGGGGNRLLGTLRSNDAAVTRTSLKT